jgi:Winged helix DNA-binding domain
VPARTWLGEEGASGDAAAGNLVRRYLAAFGPASRPDIAQWTGFARSVVDRGLAQLELRRFRDEHDRELYDLPRAPLPRADTPAPARLLPRFDNLVLSHDDRRRVLADEHRAAVIEGGEVRPTFLVDGCVAGTWSLDDGRVRLSPFDPLPRTARREVEDEAERLEAFVRDSGKA